MGGASWCGKGGVTRESGGGFGRKKRRVRSKASAASTASRKGVGSISKSSVPASTVSSSLTATRKSSPETREEIGRTSPSTVPMEETGAVRSLVICSASRQSRTAPTTTVHRRTGSRGVWPFRREGRGGRRSRTSRPADPTMEGDNQAARATVARSRGNGEKPSRSQSEAPGSRATASRSAGRLGRVRGPSLRRSRAVHCPRQALERHRTASPPLCSETQTIALASVKKVGHELTGYSLRDPSSAVSIASVPQDPEARVVLWAHGSSGGPNERCFAAVRLLGPANRRC